MREGFARGLKCWEFYRSEKVAPPPLGSGSKVVEVCCQSLASHICDLMSEHEQSFPGLSIPMFSPSPSVCTMELGHSQVNGLW